MRKIVIDIETTGQSFEKDKIISLAAVEIDEGYRLTGNMLCSLVNPKHSIPRQVSIKTGITQATIQNKPPFSELQNSFLSFVDGKDIIVFNESESLYFIYTALGFALPNEIVVLSELAKKKFPKEKCDFFALLNKFNIDNLDTMLCLRPLSKCYMLAQMYKNLTA